MADLSYSKEVLENYNNVVFIKPNDYNGWARVIEKILCGDIKMEKTPLENKVINTWNEFHEIEFKIINGKIGV